MRVLSYLTGALPAGRGDGDRLIPQPVAARHWRGRPAQGVHADRDGDVPLGADDGQGGDGGQLCGRGAEQRPPAAAVLGVRREHEADVPARQHDGRGGRRGLLRRVRARRAVPRGEE